MRVEAANPFERRSRSRAECTVTPARWTRKALCMDTFSAARHFGVSGSLCFSVCTQAKRVVPRHPFQAPRETVRAIDAAVGDTCDVYDGDITVATPRVGRDNAPRPDNVVTCDEPYRLTHDERDLTISWPKLIVEVRLEAAIVRLETSSPVSTSPLISCSPLPYWVRRRDRKGGADRLSRQRLSRR